MNFALNSSLHCREEGESSEEEDVAREITLLQGDNSILPGRPRRRGVSSCLTSRQRQIQAGRMKALEKIKAKKKGGVEGMQPSETKTQVRQSKLEKIREEKVEAKSKQSRIQRLQDSSSDEEEAAVRLDASVEKPRGQGVKRARLVIDSDSDSGEEGPSKVCRVDNSGDNICDNEITFDNARGTNPGLVTLCDNNERTELTKIKQRKAVSSSVTGARELMVNHGSRISESSVLDSSGRRFVGKPIILVDSRELSSSQDIISDLRFKHGIQVSAAQLSGCDYIVSNRMAVERKSWSEFSNGSNRARLITRLQHLGELYDRPCLIVEKDRVKPGEEKAQRPLHWTKYVDRTLSQLYRSEVKV